MLVEITERAMAHCGQSEVLIVGGVGCAYHPSASRRLSLSLPEDSRLSQQVMNACRR
jgi:tRNA A37 threonylcarbamoyltransferase TsaD